ncbi:MAG: AAA family ATPase, partial [Planctomycetes bacterium]|nr:AAA family ATPase [Planctomycetota bacterium]
VHAAGLVLAEAKSMGGNRVLPAGRSEKADFASSLPCRKLLGRDAELATAAAFFDPILRGKIATILVEGEAGSGKSRFLADVALRARAAGLLPLSFTAEDARRGLPGGLLRGLVREYSLRRPESRQALEEKLAQEPFRKGLEAALRAMASATPLLLLVDNAAAADPLSFEVLLDLVRDGSLPLGLVLALKGLRRELDDRPSAQPLLELWREAKKHAATLLRMAPLSREQAETMVRTLLEGAALPEGYSEMIAGASSGNPLYVHAALRALADRGKISRVRGGWTLAPTSFDDLPASLEKAILALAEGLPAKTADLLSQAAVTGVVLDLDVLQALAGMEEGELLDRVDELERKGLVSNGVAGRFEFTAGCIPDFRRTSIPAARLQEWRQKASEVLKRLHGIVLEPEAAAAPGTGRARLAEACHPLPETSLAAAARLVQALISELKMGRLYPKESRIRMESRERLSEALRELTAAAPRVTFTADPPLLKVNGAALAAAGDGSAPALAQMFHDKLVSSLTLDRGAAPEELLTLLEGLAAPLPRETAPPDHWDRFLDERKLAHLDILQTRHVAAASDSVLEKPLAADQMESLSALLQALKAAYDARKLYPAGHKLVEESSRRLFQEGARLLGSAPVVAFSTPQNDLVVNGISVDSRAMRGLIPWLAAEFERTGVKSVTLRQGANERDLRALATVLAAEDGPAAAQAIAAGCSDHLAFDARVYERATKQPRETAPRSAPALPKAAGVEERASALMQAAPANFLSAETERSLSLIFNDLLEAKLPRLMEPIVDRVGASLRDPAPGLRRRAAALVVRVLDQGSSGAREILVRRLESPLAAAAGAEQDEATLAVQVLALRSWLTAAAGLKQHKLMIAFMARLASNPELLRKASSIRTAVTAALASLGSTAGEQALDLLSRGDPLLRDAAGRLAALIGPSMVQPLVALAASHGDLTVRRAAAGAIRELGDGSRQLAAQVKADGPVPTLRNILSVFDLSGPGGAELSQVIKSVSAHPDPSVLEAAAGLLTRAKSLASPILVSELLASVDGPLQRGAIMVAKDLKMREAWGGILKIAEKTQDEDLLRAACNFFRECPMREALPLLVKLFNSKSRAFGLVKGMSDPTRVAATEALRRINDPEAKRLIDRALSDGSETVRRAAKPPGGPL